MDAIATNILTINAAECYRGIQDFYDLIASKLGHKNIDAINYNCTKIKVANNIADKIIDFYKKEKEAEPQDIAQWWCIAGPKAIDSLPDDTIELEEGFITIRED